MKHISIIPNLELKELNNTDAKELGTLIDKNRDYLREWLPWLDHSCCAADSLKFIEDAKGKWKQNKALVLGIWADNQIIGTISFNAINEEQQQAKIGYWLSKEYQGKGIITRACQALIDYGFNQLNLKYITISCAEENQKSQAIPIRLGFKFVKIEENKEWLYDHYVNHIVYAMDSENWKNIRKKDDLSIKKNSQLNSRL